MVLTLYYAPGACSLAAHIALIELGLEHKLVKVDTQTHKTEDGRDYKEVNPLGYVPALDTPLGIITESPAVGQYIADQKPEKHLLGDAAHRYKVISLYAFINSEVHTAYGPLFNPAITPEARAKQIEKLQSRYAYLDKLLAGKKYLTGDTFTAADAYFYVVTTWADHVKFDYSQYKHVVATHHLVSERPSVKDARTHVVRGLQACIPILPQKIFIYKPPFLFKMVWKIIHPFLTPNVINLMEIVTSTEELSKYVHPNYLLQEYGGNVNESRLAWLSNLSVDVANGADN